jgi:hypothetical protein
MPSPQRLLRAFLRPCLLTGAVLIGGLLFLAPPTGAQVDSTTLATMGPTRYDDIGWHEVILLHFDAEAARRAKALTERCLSAASTTEAAAPILVETPSGPWDVLMISPLEDAPLEKEWQTPAALSRLRSACADAFGDEEATDTWETYKDLIVRSSSMVGLSGRLGRPPERP